MKKKLKKDKDKDEKVVIALISGSVGELDWNLPILNFLIKKNEANGKKNNIKIEIKTQIFCQAVIVSR